MASPLPLLGRSSLIWQWRSASSSAQVLFQVLIALDVWVKVQMQRVFEELMGLMPSFPAGHACPACTLIVMCRGSASEEYVTFGVRNMSHMG